MSGGGAEEQLDRFKFTFSPHGGTRDQTETLQISFGDKARQRRETTNGDTLKSPIFRRLRSNAAAYCGYIVARLSSIRGLFVDFTKVTETRLQDYQRGEGEIQSQSV